MNLFYLLLALLTFEHRSWSSDFQSPRTAGLGGAGHAAPSSNDATYLNPSYASFIKAHVASLGVAGGPKVSSPIGPLFTLSVLDGGEEQIVQSGLSYSQRPDGALTTLGFSKSFLQDWSVGLSGKIMIDPIAGNFQFADTSISVSRIFSDALQTSLIADNLVAPQPGMNQGFYREITIGTQLILKNSIKFYIDPHWTPDLPGASTVGLESGVEAQLPIEPSLFVRLGGFYNSAVSFAAARANGFGFGMGWSSKSFSIDLAYSSTNTSTGPYAFVSGGSLIF